MKSVGETILAFAFWGAIAAALVFFVAPMMGGKRGTAECDQGMTSRMQDAGC